MKLKIFYRSPVVWNTILASLFSFVFIYFQNLAYTNNSILDKTHFISFINNNIIYFCSLFFISFSIYRMVNYARFLFLSLIVFTTFLTLLNLYADFSKIILVLLFCYISASYYFYQFYSAELKESYYCPLFSEEELFDPMLLKIRCEVELDKKSYRGHLTNWSSNGGFISFADQVEEVELIKKSNQIKVFFESHVFLGEIAIVSSLGEMRGVGIKILNNSINENKKALGWMDFYEIINDMGFSPELVS